VELSPCVVSGVECVDIVWIGSGVRFASVYDDDVVSPESCAVTASFGRGREGIGEGSNESPFEEFDVETVDEIVDCH